MPSSSSAPTGHCARSRPIWAASSATLPARSTATTGSRAASLSCSASLDGYERRSADSAAPRSTACMPPKWNASARARPISLTSFVAHVRALPGSPYDGHTLAEVIPGIEKLVGTTIERLHADAGYRGHNAPADYKFKIYTSKQKSRLP